MRRPDLTVLAIPAFVGAIAAEVLWQRRNPAPPGTTRAGDYELADTIASLTMGVGSLVAPFVSARLLDPVTPGRGRYAKVLMGAAVAASAATTVADVVRRRREQGGLPDAGVLPAADPRAPRTGPDAVPHLRDAPLARRVTGATAVAAVASTALTVATTWSAQTSGTRLFAVTKRDLGTGLAANAVAILGWDFIYYWNHRFMHESRWLWAIHVVHHSSERYNLSTALRQPVADGLTMSVPYGLLALVGVRPERHRAGPGAQPALPVLDPHRGDPKSIGWLENGAQHPVAPPGAPRHQPPVPRPQPRQHPDHLGPAVRHLRARGRAASSTGSRRTSTPTTRSPSPPTSGVTSRATSPGRDSWRERWSFLLRGPGWAYDRRAEILGAAAAKDAVAA